MRRPFTHAAALILVSGLVGDSGFAAQQNRYQRPTSITATITGSPKLRDGTFAGKGTSGICGEIPKMSSMTGEDTFVIEFSDGPQSPGSVYNVSFGSNQLVRGATSASKFRLNVSVVTADGGKPPVYALDSQTPKPGESGTVTLSQKGQATTLSLTGMNDMKERITLLITCG